MSPSTREPSPTLLAQAKAYTGVLWHVGAFVIINGFFWILDLTIGQSGAQWAPWITLFWGFALAFHILAYWVTSAGERKTQRLIDVEDEPQPRTPQMQ